MVIKMGSSQSIKEKLISSSLLKNDPSINTKLSENCIDLKKWCFDNEIIKFLTNENCNKLLIDLKYNPIEIANKLSESKNIGIFLDISKSADIYLTKNEINLLSKNFLDNKNNVFNRIHNDLILGNKRFLKIKREADRRFNDESVWYLYVGAFFLTGKTIDGDNICAPILLYKVSITNINGELHIIKKDKEVYFNQKLKLFLKQNYNIDIPISEHTNINDANKILDFLKPITNGTNFDFTKIKEINEFGENKLPIDKFVIEPYATYCLSDPCGGIVLADYEKIISQNIDPFNEISVISHTSQYENDIIENDDLSMFNRPLNIYQKYAVKSALNESSLIMGPPGTGKSEVIATIIANIVNNDKTVLMVSEKKAALDVLEERLEAIGNICLFAYNTHDEKYFYNKIKKIHDLINEEVNFEPLPNSLVYYKKIKDTYKSLNNINNIIINDKHIDEIQYVPEENRKFSKPLILLFKKLSDISNEKNIEIVFQLFSHIFKKLNQYKNYFPNIIKLNELIELKQIADNSKNSKSIYKYYFLNKKIKKYIYKIQSIRNNNELSNLELDNLINIVNNIIDLKIINITKSEIILFNELTYSNIKELTKEFDSYILDLKLEEYEYTSKPLLNTIYNNYISAQKRCVKNVDEIICYNYIHKLKKWIQEIESSNNEQIKEDLKELFRIAALKIPQPINVTIKKYYNLLRKMFPIWILNPVQTSQVTPCEKGIFDYGVFDEASQMFYENSYPLVFRVKKSIVCGDDKQLSPIGNFATKSFDDTYIDEYDSESSIVSLFEKASTLSWPHYQLKNHYRSSSYELISFANKYIYNNEMNVITKNAFFNRVVNTYNVDGILENNINKIEIEKVLELINEKYKNKNSSNISVLVIAFHNKQMETLEFEFNHRLNEMNQFAVDAYRNKNLIFGSIENIQGLEADDIIISVTFAKDKNGSLTTDFKPFSDDGGTNRLNVAITRAKNEMTIVKSFYANDTINTSNTDLNIFIKFIEWCDKINSQSTIIDQIKIQKNTDISLLNNQFEIEVYNLLNELINHDLYKIVTKLWIGTSTLDICIIDKKTHSVKLGIQCDNNSYENSLKKMIENLDNQKLLTDRGYPIFRITLIEWKIKNLLIVNELNTLIK